MTTAYHARHEHHPETKIEDAPTVRVVQKNKESNSSISIEPTDVFRGASELMEKLLKSLKDVAQFLPKQHKELFTLEEGQKIGLVIVMRNFVLAHHELIQFVESFDPQHARPHKNIRHLLEIALRPVFEQCTPILNGYFVKNNFSAVTAQEWEALLSLISSDRDNTLCVRQRTLLRLSGDPFRFLSQETKKLRPEKPTTSGECSTPKDEHATHNRSQSERLASEIAKEASDSTRLAVDIYRAIQHSLNRSSRPQ